MPTLTLEDDIGGLEIRVPDGKSIAVEPEPGTLLVHVGEILAFATRGRFCATPPSSHQSTVRSIPRVNSHFSKSQLANDRDALAELSDGNARGCADDSHVHRVLSLATRWSIPVRCGRMEQKRTKCMVHECVSSSD